MLKNLSINDAIFGLVWCVAAKDNKVIGFTKKNEVSDAERNFLQNIFITNKIKTSNYISIEDNNDLKFYNKDGYENFNLIWRNCYNKIKESSRYSKVKTVSLMFNISYIEMEIDEVYNRHFSGSKKELSFIYETINKININEDDLSKIIEGTEPEIICSYSNESFYNELIELEEINSDLAKKIITNFDNSYQFSIAPLKDLINKIDTNIELVNKLQKKFSLILD